MPRQVEEYGEFLMHRLTELGIAHRNDHDLQDLLKEPAVGLVVEPCQVVVVFQCNTLPWKHYQTEHPRDVYFKDLLCDSTVFEHRTVTVRFWPGVASSMGLESVNSGPSLTTK